MAVGKSVALEAERWDAAMAADWRDGTLLPARPLSLEWQGSKTWLLIKEGIHIILDRILLKDPAHLSSKCPLYSRLSRVEKRALVLRYASALVLRTPLRRDVLVDTVTMCVFEACEQEAVLEAPADGKRKPRQPFMQKVMGEALQELLGGHADEQDKDFISALLQHKATDLIITDAVDRMREVWMSEQVASFFDRLSEGDKPPPVIHCPDVAASFGIDYFLPPPPELTASDERSLNEAIRADEDDAGKETVFAANLKKAQRLARQQRQKGKRLQQQLRGALESSGPVAAAAAAAAAEAAGLSHEAADASAAAVSGLTASASVAADSGDNGAGACTAPSVPPHSALLQSSVGAALRSLRLGSTGTAGAAKEGVEAGTRADSAATAEAMVKTEAAAYTPNEDTARLGHPSGSGAGADDDTEGSGSVADAGEAEDGAAAAAAEASAMARRKRSFLRQERQLALLRQHEQELRASQASQLAVASVAGRGNGDWWWTQGWVGRYCRAVGKSSSSSAAAAAAAASSSGAASSEDESDSTATALATVAMGSISGDTAEATAKSHASPAVVSALSAAHKLGPVADALSAEAAWPSVNGLTAAATEGVNPHARVLRALAEDPLQWATAWSGMCKSLRSGVAALSAAEVCDVIDSQPLWLSLRGMVGCNLWRDGVWPIISNDGHLTWVRFAKSNAERFWFLDGGDALALVPMFLAWSQTVVVSARSELDAIGEALTDQRPEDVSRGVQTHLENAVAAALLVKIADYALQMSEAARASSVSRRILAEWNEEEEAAKERERVREEREVARKVKLAQQQKADAAAKRAREELEAAAEASRKEKEEEERTRKQTAAAAAAAARLEAEEAAARKIMRQQEAQVRREKESDARARNKAAEAQRAAAKAEAKAAAKAKAKQSSSSWQGSSSAAAPPAVPVVASTSRRTKNDRGAPTALSAPLASTQRKPAASSTASASHARPKHAADSMSTSTTGQTRAVTATGRGKAGRSELSAAPTTATPQSAHSTTAHRSRQRAAPVSSASPSRLTHPRSNPPVSASGTTGAPAGWPQSRTQRGRHVTSSPGAVQSHASLPVSAMTPPTAPSLAPAASLTRPSRLTPGASPSPIQAAPILPTVATSPASAGPGGLGDGISLHMGVSFASATQSNDSAAHLAAFSHGRSGVATTGLGRSSSAATHDGSSPPLVAANVRAADRASSSRVAGVSPIGIPTAAGAGAGRSAGRIAAGPATSRRTGAGGSSQISSASAGGSDGTSTTSGGLDGFGTGHLSPPRAASMGLGEASLGDSLLGGGGVGMSGLGGLGGLDDSSGGLVGMGGIGVGSLTGGFTLADDGSSSAGDAGTSGSNQAGADAAEASLNMSLSFLSD